MAFAYPENWRTLFPSTSGRANLHEWMDVTYCPHLGYGVSLHVQANFVTGRKALNRAMYRVGHANSVKVTTHGAGIENTTLGMHCSDVLPM